MDNETYEETRVKRDESWAKWIKEGDNIALISWNGIVITVDVPKTVTLAIAETDPGVKGNTASGGSKPATLETGAVVQVLLSTDFTSFSLQYPCSYLCTSFLSHLHVFRLCSGGAMHSMLWSVRAKLKCVMHVKPVDKKRTGACGKGCGITDWMHLLQAELCCAGATLHLDGRSHPSRHPDRRVPRQGLTARTCQHMQGACRHAAPPHRRMPCVGFGRWHALTICWYTVHEYVYVRVYLGSPAPPLARAQSVHASNWQTNALQRFCAA